MPNRDLFDDIIEALRRRQLNGMSAAELDSANAGAFFNPVPAAPPAGQSASAQAGVPGISPSEPAMTVVVPKAGTAPPAPFAPPGPAVSAPPAATADRVGGAGDLAALAAIVRDCTGCSLHRTRTNSVFGEGSGGAELMFIGEAPGFHEDQAGRPFVGPAGQLLDKMIAAMQFSRESVYIANVAKCRPPGNRNPEDDEAAACLPYLNRQIDLIRPRILVLLGAVPLVRLLGKTGITNLHGHWFEYRGIPTMCTFHPSYLLRSPARKKEAWEDLQQVMKRLGKDPQETMKKMSRGN